MSQKKQYKLEPPDGGWGYIVTLSMNVMIITAIGRFIPFGLIYGKHISQIGDEASITATLVSILNTFLCLMGLVVNKLLQKYSCRFVGALGSIISTIGYFLTAFCTTLAQLILTYSIIQGIGLGLMIPTTYITFSKYFSKKRNFLMIASQTATAAVFMGVPYFARTLMDKFGYQGTIFIISAITLNSFAGMLTFQPVERHMIKVYLPTEETNCLIIDQESKEIEFQVTEEANEHISTINKVWNCITNFLEVSLLKDPIFVNIVIGVSLAFLSDLIFISMLPMFFNHRGYKMETTTYLMTIYMIADLVGRILLSVLTGFVKIKIRYVFLFGCIFTALFRIAFTLNLEIWNFTVLVTAVLGAFRSTIQATVTLVLVDYSPVKFPAAFGLFSFISGISSIALGQVSSWVAKVTVGDTWVQNLLTILVLLCAIPWTLELIWNKIKKN